MTTHDILSRLMMIRSLEESLRKEKDELFEAIPGNDDETLKMLLGCSGMFPAINRYRQRNPDATVSDARRYVENLKPKRILKKDTEQSCYGFDL